MGCKITTQTLQFAGTSKLSCRGLEPKPYPSLQPQHILKSSIKNPSSTLSTSRLIACKLGIASYSDFEYNAEGGKGTGSGTTESNDEVSVSFDINTLYIPPLQTATTKFLGLPLPPFLKIDIVPELFRGTINIESGKVDLEFKAKFWFSVGSIYKAPPLVVETVLTSEESKGKMRSGKGERLDEQGNCKLVGVATIDDIFITTFLGLPTECLAGMNAVISLSPA